MYSPVSDSQLRRPSKKFDCSSPKLTDQSQSPMTDINRIMEQYARTGMLPSNNKSPLTYVNDVDRPSFESAHQSHQNAKYLFDSLPQALKNELSNDYKMLEPWLSNPKNHPDAIRYGLLVPKQKADGIPAGKSEAKEPTAPLSSTPGTSPT